MRPHRIEIAQHHRLESGSAGWHITEHLLDRELGTAVGIRGREGVFLHERQRPGLAVYGCGGAEDDALYAVRAHRLEKPQGAADVDVIVLERLGDRLPHRLEPGEVNDRRVAAG